MKDFADNNYIEPEKVSVIQSKNDDDVDIFKLYLKCVQLYTLSLTNPVVPYVFIVGYFLPFGRN